MPFPHPLGITRATHHYCHDLRVHILITPPDSNTGLRYFIVMWPEATGHGVIMDDGTLAPPMGREAWLDAITVADIFGDDAHLFMDALLEAAKC